jgi:hypothetical protein
MCNARRYVWICVVNGLMGFICIGTSASAYAWGDEGHEVVGLIADHYLDAAVRTKVQTILAGDITHLTPDTGIASEATWADKFRDSDRNTTKVHYNQTHNWHFVDIELDQPNIDSACFNHPPIPTGTVASEASPDDCVVDKVTQFAAELKSMATTPDEKREALQFLLHFVGDLHQPLHSSDDHDKGGNDKHVLAVGIKANNLHHFWDTEFVLKLGSDPQQVANALITKITPGQITSWHRGTPATWATQSYSVAKAKVYAPLPTPDAKGRYRISSAYIHGATAAVSTQLSRAGVRLAMVLNQAL